MNNMASEYGSISALTMRSESFVNSAGTGHYKYDPYATNEHFPLANMEFNHSSRNLTDKDGLYAAPRTRTKRRFFLWGSVSCSLIILLVAIVVPLYIFVLRPKIGSTGSGSNGSGSSSNGSGSDPDPDSGSTFNTTGGNGSTVTKADGTSFIYNSTFGGYWVYDPANPLNNSARAQSY